jgi:3-deoxy-D-manno-octulosonate 8-phosphate phosphatase (KDO 8-P phosphatase)
MKHFVLDVDGVMTTGQFYCSSAGKQLKVFGPDDHDALALLRDRMDIVFVTGDRSGFEISRSRIVDHMKYPLHLVSTVRRAEWIEQRFDPAQTVYMGDGIFDCYVMSRVGYAIAPANADDNAKASAHHVTRRSGGDRAVAEACLHLLERFFEPFDPARPSDAAELAGGWTT